MNRITWLVLSAVGILLPGFSYAAEIYTEITQASNVGVYNVSVFIDSEDSVNALQGELQFPENFMKVTRVSDGNSTILFWLEKPRVEGDTILFSGVTPGGFSGKKRLIFSFVMEQTREGKGSLVFSNISALKNDGEGTPLPLTARKAVVGGSSVSSGFDSTVQDQIPPESFTPYVGRSGDIFEGRSFVVFSTTDKDSGVRGYEVKESRFKWLSGMKSWIPAESPYVLQDQDLKSYVFIKAIDDNSNERIEIIYPDMRWYENITYWIIIVGVLALFYFTWKRKRHI